jgi:hypothetical protein
MTKENSITLELNGDEYTVDDAACMESWIKGLWSIIEDLAEKNGFEKYQSVDKLSEDEERKIAGAISFAMMEFRGEAAIIDGDTSALWRECMIRTLESHVGNMCFDYGDDLHNIIRKNLESFYVDIESAMEDHGGPVCDADTVLSKMLDEVIIKIEENDTSNILDEIGSLQIRMVYTPGIRPGSIAQTDLTISSADICRENPAHNTGMHSFIKLFGVSPLALLEAINVDYTDTALIDAWIQFASESIQHSSPLLSISELVEIVEADCSNNSTPCWIGMLSVNDLLKIDPSKPFDLRGGAVGLHDFVNGSGWLNFLPDSACISVQATEFLTCEVGYGEHSVYGHRVRDLKASVNQSQPAKNPRKELVSEEQPAQTF